MGQQFEPLLLKRRSTAGSRASPELEQCTKAISCLSSWTRICGLFTLVDTDAAQARCTGAAGGLNVVHDQGAVAARCGLFEMEFEYNSIDCFYGRMLFLGALVFRQQLIWVELYFLGMRQPIARSDVCFSLSQTLFNQHHSGVLFNQARCSSSC